jgi:Skp family chaperone for outer membrane proteins
MQSDQSASADDQIDPSQLPPMPPVPQLPALPKAAPPPAAVVGVLGVPDVMRVSTAAQEVDKVIGERRQKLNEDAQKEQAAWRELNQTLATQRASLSPDQIRARERELQERITNAQRQFRDRNKIIQEAAQVAMGQIERVLIAVIRQVAESHGMNLVLHRTQVALNINEFDITDQVGEQFNKLMPTVTITPDGQVPTAANSGLTAMVNQSAAATPPAGSAPAAIQASAPAAPAPASPPPVAAGPRRK